MTERTSASAGWLICARPQYQRHMARSDVEWAKGDAWDDAARAATSFDALVAR